MNSIIKGLLEEVEKILGEKEKLLCYQDIMNSMLSDSKEQLKVCINGWRAYLDKKKVSFKLINELNVPRVIQPDISIEAILETRTEVKTNYGIVPFFKSPYNESIADLENICAFWISEYIPSKDECVCLIRIVKKINIKFPIKKLEFGNVEIISNSNSHESDIQFSCPPNTMYRILANKHYDYSKPNK
jgi:hypothetical protein